MKSKILNKEQHYKLYESNFYGNRPRIWNSYDELIRSGYQGLITVRYKGFGNSDWCKYYTSINDIPPIIQRWVSEGADEKLITLNESVPDDKLTVQGEVMENPKYRYVLSYSHEKIPMRNAMEMPMEMKGDSVLSFLKKYMDNFSFGDLQRLFGLFDQSVIEFSCYSIYVGCLPNRNTILWEVRNY